jgi:quinol monooxygenase YgiN
MPKLESKSSRKKNAAKTNPVTVICRFTVKPDSEKEFVKLLSRDWPNLLRLGLATKDEPTVYRHVDESGGPVYFQIMTWASEQAVASAHAHPEVLTVWKAFDALTEKRGGHVKCEFPEVTHVSMYWVGIRGLSDAAGRH